MQSGMYAARKDAASTLPTTTTAEGSGVGFAVRPPSHERQYASGAVAPAATFARGGGRATVFLRERGSDVKKRSMRAQTSAAFRGG